MMSEQRDRDSVYSPVDRQVLDELSMSFDTSQILDAVYRFDEIRYRICEPQGL